MKEIDQLIRPTIRSLEPYSSARDEYTGSEALFLDANENPYNGPYNRYPDPHQQLLKEKISRLKSIPAANIFAGNGSDEAIDLLFRVFCEPGSDNVVSIDPTYGMYSVCAGINNTEYRRVPLGNGFSLDTAAIEKACDSHTKLVFLCSPNNPTSNSFDPEEMLSLVERLNTIIVVDEAYIDFSKRPSLKDRVMEYPNLVVLQTFSKAWAMAAIRLGIALASEEIIAYMNKVKYPYNVNMLTQQYALEAIEKADTLEERTKVILDQRKTLERKLKKFRFVLQVFPSDANFLLVRVDKPKKIYNYLIGKKIIVRDRSDAAMCEGSLRITVGTPEENDALTGALMEYQRDFVDSCRI